MSKPLTLRAFAIPSSEAFPPKQRLPITMSSSSANSARPTAAKRLSFKLQSNGMHATIHLKISRTIPCERFHSRARRRVISKRVVWRMFPSTTNPERGYIRSPVPNPGTSVDSGVPRYQKPERGYLLRNRPCVSSRSMSVKGFPGRASVAVPDLCFNKTFCKGKQHATQPLKLFGRAPGTGYRRQTTSDRQSCFQSDPQAFR